MKTRIQELQIPDRPTIWVVEIRDREPHHFKLPALSLMERVTDAYREQTDEDGRISHAYAIEAGSAFVGLCWHHETLELETPRPDAFDPASIAAYAWAVQEELSDAGYSIASQHGLAQTAWNHVQERFRSALSEIREAHERADFSSAPKVSPTGASSSAGSSGPAIRVLPSAGPVSNG